MAIPEEIINEIKYRNDIETVIAPYVALKRAGKNLKGLCPFHSEKTPSFTVYPENGSFYCFGCGTGGDVFTFTKLIENLDYIEAVKLLAERSGITIPESGYDDSYQKLKEKIFEINRETAKFYHDYLMSPDGKWALDYLLGRGLKVATIKHFGLGAAPDSWDALIKHLRKKGFTEYEMFKANVVGQNGKGNYYDRFRRRVMFPIINIRGRVIAFSGRVMPGDDKPGGKYVNTADTPIYKKSENLFGMNFAKNKCEEEIILVEGNMDVISLHQAGFENAVAALGTAFTKEQANIIARYTNKIVLMLDADEAGQKAVRRASEILRNTGLETRVVVVPEGKDPDEFIKNQGAERFGALLGGAVSEIEYKLLTAVSGIDIKSDDGKRRYLIKAAEILADENDSITRDLYEGRLSDKYGVSKTAIKTTVDEIRAKRKKVQQKKEFSEIIRPKVNTGDINPERRKNAAVTAAEENIISVLLSNPDFFESAYEKLKPDDMFTVLNKRIYGILCELLADGGNVELSYFGERLDDREYSYIISLLNRPLLRQNALAVLNDSIAAIKNNAFNESVSDTKNLSAEDWALNMQKIIENKQKGIKE